MNQIKKTITIYIPGNACNMRCEYCYITECFKNSRNTELAKFKVGLEDMIYAFRPERIGGLAHIIVIGQGETLIPPETVPLCKGLLQQGHIVEVVTNGSLSQRIDELLDCDKECLSRLIIKCSLHWNELKRLKLIDVYFNNIKKALDAGASSYPFLVVGKTYMNSLDEIKQICLERLGGLPHCTPCVVANSYKEMIDGNFYRTDPPCTEEFVENIREKFSSELFNQSVRFLDVDVKKIFCYAGTWSFGVLLDSGIITRCHNSFTGYNFFDKIEEPMPPIDPICNECGLASCALQYDMFSMGLIPEIPDVPTYAQMMCDGNSFFTNTIRKMMDFKLYDRNKKMSDIEEREYLFEKITNLSNENETLKYGACNNNGWREILRIASCEDFHLNELVKIKYKDYISYIKLMRNTGASPEQIVQLLSSFVSRVLLTRSYMTINYVFNSVSEIYELPVTMIVSNVNDVDGLDDVIARNDAVSLAASIYLYLQDE